MSFASCDHELVRRMSRLEEPGHLHSGSRMMPVGRSLKSSKLRPSADGSGEIIGNWRRDLALRSSKPLAGFVSGL